MWCQITHWFLNPFHWEKKQLSNNSASTIICREFLRCLNLLPFNNVCVGVSVCACGFPLSLTMCVCAWAWVCVCGNDFHALDFIVRFVEPYGNSDFLLQSTRLWYFYLTFFPNITSFDLFLSLSISTSFHLFLLIQIIK